MSALLQEQTLACDTHEWAQCLVTTAVFDVRWNSRFGAMLNLLRSLFVIVALGCGAVLFNNDSNRLVLRPIERMLRKVCFLVTSVDAACWLASDLASTESLIGTQSNMYLQSLDVMQLSACCQFVMVADVRCFCYRSKLNPVLSTVHHALT